VTEARLFVALDLPAAVRAQLVGWARRCASSLRAADGGWGSHADVHEPRAPGAHAGRTPPARRRPTGRLRLLEADSLHLTLYFLGSRPSGEIEALGAALELACAAAPPLGELELGAPLWLPPRRPRALAVELHDDAEHALQALHEAVVREISEVCDAAPATGGAAARRGAGKTVGRGFRPHVTVARMRSGDAPRERLLPATPPLSFSAQTATLYRSWLTPSEAHYEGLATHALAAPTG
jgi:RNA 2',3'-cyclic 3'-phosphodiesterase